MYDSSDGEFLLITKGSQPEDETIVRMSTSSTGPELDLQIVGNNLVVSDEFSDGWLFDIDFNAQHKKFFEQTSAVYLMQLPNIIANSSTPKYAIAHVTNNLDASAALTVNLAINSSSYEPIAADAELTDIDVNDWFDNEDGSAHFGRIARLVKLILQMEYFLPESVTINIGNESQDTWTVDGGLWNLFTDGSVYVPLMLTSRLPGGSPLKVNEDSEDPAIETPKMVCSFNRPTTYAELLLHDFEAVTTDLSGAFAEKVPFIRYDENQYCFGNNEEGGAWVELRNNGTELWSILAGCVWNINLDNQFKRQLRIVDEGGSEDWAFRRILTPDYISDSPYQCVLGFKTDVDGDYIYIPINVSGEIRVFDPRNNSYVYRQSEIQVGNLVSIVAKMYRMEFEMLYGGVFSELDDMPEDLPNGTFDMFTDSEVIV